MPTTSCKSKSLIFGLSFLMTIGLNVSPIYDFSLFFKGLAKGSISALNDIEFFNSNFSILACISCVF
jgi:hypothetical protein